MRYIPFEDRVQRRGSDECWSWTGTVNRDGYGVHAVGGKRFRMAHRVAYETAVGPIPDGLEIDHLCRNRGCVNPAHLEPVTRRENVLRSEGVTAINARKTHCHRGHEFTPENIYWRKSGARECWPCKRERRATGRAA